MAGEKAKRVGGVFYKPLRTRHAGQGKKGIPLCAFRICLPCWQLTLAPSPSPLQCASLELELRTVRASLDEIIVRFDDQLLALAAKHNAAASKVAALESRLIGMATAVEGCLAASEAAEKEAYIRLAEAKEAQSKASAELSDKRAALAVQESKSADIAAEEKHMDKNFRKVCERVRCRDGEGRG